MHENKEITISGIEIIPIRPQNGLVGFTSFLLNKSFYIGGVSIRTDLKNKSYRLCFPEKKLNNGQIIPIAHPIDKETERFIKSKVVQEYVKLVKTD